MNEKVDYVFSAAATMATEMQEERTGLGGADLCLWLVAVEIDFFFFNQQEEFGLLNGRTVPILALWITVYFPLITAITTAMKMT